MISLPSIETLSTKLSNLSLNSTLESGGLYIFPIKNGLRLPSVISSHIHAVLFVSRSNLRLALIPFRTYTRILPPPLPSLSLRKGS